MKSIFLKISVLLLFLVPTIHDSAGLNNSSSDQNVVADEEDLRCVIRDDQGNKLAACWFCDCEQVAYWVEDMIASE